MEGKETKKLDLQKLKESLHGDPLERGRYRIEYSREEIAAALRLCYIDAVERRQRNGGIRGIAYQEDQDTAKHIEKTAQWLCGNYCPGLLLCGSCGNGKSTMLEATRKLIQKIAPSMSITKISAIDYAKLAERAPETYARIQMYEMLELDDVGMEPTVIKIFGTETSPIVETLYRRCDRQMWTIISSNLNRDDILRRYGVRIDDRLTECYDTIPFDNMSYRQPKTN